MYTGALENRPDLIAGLVAERDLWGNDPSTVCAVRDPILLHQALTDGGFAAIPIERDPRRLPRDGSWLRKPVRSAGGYGIEPVKDELLDPSTFYYQKRIPGRSLSAVFLGDRHGARLAGITRQLIGRPKQRFAYRGNVAPWPVSPIAARRIAESGHLLAARFGLVGLFGIDLVLGREIDDEPRVVEVNPRYTASVEVIELAFTRSLLNAHRIACLGQPIGDSWPPDRATRVVAKEVIFADLSFDFEAPRSEIFWDASHPFRVPEAADVPEIGTRFEPGSPVLTIFGTGSTPEEALAALKRNRDAWRVRFRGS